jgi:YggT family protein
MLYQIISLLLDVAVGLLGGACLLRLYMQYQRVPFGNPVGRFVFALTDWLVLPLRRVCSRPWAGWIPPACWARTCSSWRSTRSVVAAGRGVAAAMLPVLAAFGLAQAGDLGPDRAVIVYAILSWVQSDSPLVRHH